MKDVQVPPSYSFTHVPPSHLFTHPINKYLLSTYYMLGIFRCWEYTGKKKKSLTSWSLLPKGRGNRE